ncbi:MAG: PEGA domain-containing protein [Deltaproteobacteria bacterium]|nr:PEGA domain-containing protein [Deltaproteobacteria bacterium]
MAKIFTLIFLLMTFSPSVSHGISTKKARESFNAGQALFGAGEYKKAAEKFLEAYKQKPLAAFLYNAAVCFEKIEDYTQAKKFFVEYVAKSPSAKGISAIQARIRLLNKLISIQKENEKRRIDAEKKDAENKKNLENANKKNPDGKKNPDKKPIPEKTKIIIIKKPPLPPIETKNVTSISTEPPGSELFLDDEKNKLGKTPWEGVISDGKHVIIIKQKGFQTIKKEITITKNRFTDIFINLNKDAKLAWVQITTDSPDAYIYPGSKSVGAIGKTPWSGFLKPGKHQLIISKEGFDEIKTVINAKAGETNQFDFKLKKTPIAYLSVFGKNVRNAKIKIDGRTVCVAPCLKVKIKSGTHRLEISKKGMKSVEKKLNFAPGDHKNFNVTLHKSPNRAGAITAYVIGLASLGGGIWLGGMSKKIEDDFNNDIKNGVPVYSNDPRLQDGKIYSIAADVLYGLSALSLVIAVIRTFSDSGPDSTINQSINIGTTSVSLDPVLSGNQTGISLTVKF